MLLGQTVETFLTIRLCKILMNNFLQCSSFMNWCFHFEEKDVVRNTVLECPGEHCAGEPVRN